MARIAGVELQDNWRIDYALTKIKGIGWVKSSEVLGKTKVKPSTRVSALSSDDISTITGALGGYVIEGDLLRAYRESIARLRAIGSYRGLRHARGLPVRGQRTRSNARTKRGSRKTVGSFKKEELTKQAQQKKEG